MVLQCPTRVPWREAVVRSLITIKALTYGPTGGIVAAPTTSLPELVGGERNWDYRFCWLRDATFTILSLLNAGYRHEAEAWADWLLRAIAGLGSQVQPLYGVAGERRMHEHELDWLPGYKDSRPVRSATPPTPSSSSMSSAGPWTRCTAPAAMASTSPRPAGACRRRCCATWRSCGRKPDEGIWEVRSEPQHFVHSKVMCWVAFDRAISAVERFGLEGPVDHWREIRDTIHAEVCERGYDEDVGAFVQAYGEPHLDAATLLIPLVGFLPAKDPRVLSTTAAIERELMRDGYVLRYDTDRSDDGLEGDEGAFLACTFWLADNMILQDREADARKLFERLLAVQRRRAAVGAV
jgi:GH15 family glucan-1,4-alpha-glucosidase